MATSNSMTNKRATVAGSVQFSEFCGLLDKIQKSHGNDRKKGILKTFVDKWRSFQLSNDDEKHTEADSFYPVMRLLLPHLDKDRPAYGIKEHSYAKLLIEVLCLGKDSPHAQLLLHFKAPKLASVAGDFAMVAQRVLKNRCPARGLLTIEEANTSLDAIATAVTKEVVRKNMIHLLQSLSATENVWLIRIITKNLKLGLSQVSVLNVYHPDAAELFNVNNSLDKVCRLLKDPKIRSHEIGITVFSPFSPMLGERASPDKVEELMASKMYLIETKFDGERVLLHKDDNDFKYFSRSGNEYTQVFGASMFGGTLTQYIANCFKPGVKRCILDGEMLGYHVASQTFGTKGEQFDIKSKDVLERTGYQPCIQVFDILLLNDKVLTNCPVKERKQQIEEVVIPLDGRMMISTHRLGKTNQDCVDALNEAIDNKEEGIMVKLAESVYRPNTRKGGWYKIKPEYVGGLMDELDLLIVGGYLGVGSRGGLMSHFLCAAALPPQEGDKPKIFHSFCKVGSGYSKKQLLEFNRQMAPYWQTYDKRRPPDHLELASGFKEKPDAWLPPDKSFIVQVIAAEIIDSDRFRLGCTLRFPRVEKIRDDKPWYQCMTTVEIEDLRQKSGGKLAGSKMELGEGSPKKKRKLTSRAVRPTLMEQFKGVDVAQVTQVSTLLDGKEFCVINGPPSYPKQTLEKKIVELGGIIVQNPGNQTQCVIADKCTVRVNNMVKNNKWDIVKADWLIRVLDSSLWIPWCPSDMIHTTPRTQQMFQQDFDQYGDSYRVDTTAAELTNVFAKMQDQVDPVDQDTIAQLEEEYFPDESPFGLFRTCSIYVDNNLVLSEPDTHIRNCPLDVLPLELRFFGAVVPDDLNSDVSHVVVHASDLSRIPTIKELRSTRRKKFHIVKESWVRVCLEEGAIVSEKPHEL